ncbi:MAG TPA: FAD:protein FMN transferase [Candidatus Saccharicenans sp.]|nr:FAD:protein FMN transferase [Candidatus Saccharicenans sp.]
MSTFFELLVAGEKEIYARSAAQAFFKEIDRLERLFSRFDPGSEISMINRLKPGETLPIGIETYECLKMSFELMVETGGAFNINFRAIKNKQVAGGGGSNKRTDETLNSAKSGDSQDNKIGRAVGTVKSEAGSGQRDKSEKEAWAELFPLELIETQSQYLALRLEESTYGLDLDLGAIGKGYALEAAAGLLSSWEIDSFLANAGQSTVLARGKEAWQVTVGGGFDFLKPGRVGLKNRALSGSGHEVKGEHIYDPRRRQALSRQLAVWVSHPSPALSDGLSTAFMVMDLKEIEAAAADRPEIWTLVVGRDKNCYWFNRPADFSQNI